MRLKYTAVRVRPAKRAMVVTVEIDYGSTKRWVDLRIPWRMINQQYREVIEHLEDEAQDHLAAHRSDTPLPLEKWE